MSGLLPILESGNRSVSGRATGGYAYGKKNKLPKNTPAWNEKRDTKASGGAFSTSCLEAHKARKDPSRPPPTINGAEASRGVMSLIERGLLLPSQSQRGGLPSLTPSDLLGPGIAAQPATLHNPVNSFRRSEVAATSASKLSAGVPRGGASAAFGVRYDLALIEATVPSKALNDPTSLPPPGKTTLFAKAGIQKTLRENPALDDSRNTPVETKHLPSPPPREDTRTYTELLDLYSLHEFVIRKGSALRSTPEFASYMRSFEFQWGAINQLIAMLEELLTSYSVPLAYIDGKKLANLARVDLGAPSQEELCSCITNIADIGHYLVTQSQAFRGTGSSAKSPAMLLANSGHHAAATAIQSTYRMHRVHTYYQRLRVATWAVRVIQKQWACHRMHTSTKRAISQLRDAVTLRWRETMESFISSWPQIKTQRRTIIHIPSLSTLARLTAVGPSSMPASAAAGSHSSNLLPSLQAAQLPRLADLRDPNVDVIMVTPFKVDQEVLQHYTSAITASRKEDDSVPWTSPASRLTVLVPENARRLPPNLPLTSMILLSTKMMRCLANLVRGKVAYIVPGEVGPEELQLASKLNIPLLGVEPGIAPALSTKGGQRTIFEAADAATPVGARDLRSMREAFLVIGRLVFEYQEISRWILKIDSETNSRGHAVLDVQRLNCFSSSNGLTAEAVTRELAELAPKKIKIIHTEAYPDWIAYMNMFDSVGGCVEAYPPGKVIASPIVNLFIDPHTGVPEVCSVVDSIHSPSLTVLGHQFPPACLLGDQEANQPRIPYHVLRDAAIAIGSSAFRRRVIGYCSVDFVVFLKSSSVVDSGGETNQPRLRIWAVDLDLRLTDGACMHRYVTLVTGSSSEPDPTTGLSYFTPMPASSNAPAQPRRVLRYIYSGLLHHPYIGAVRHSSYFNKCRQRGNIAYSLDERTGVIFHLIDSLLRGCVGMVGVGKTFTACIDSLADAIQLLQSDLPSHVDGSAEGSNLANFTTALKVLAATYNTRRAVGPGAV